MFAAFLPSLAFETWLLCSVSYNGHRKARRSFTNRNTSEKILLELLLRDTFIWFGGAFVFLFGNVVVFRFAGPIYSYIGIPFLITGTSVGGCRLVLNVRQAYFVDEEEEIDEQWSFRGAALSPSSIELREIQVQDNGLQIPADVHLDVRGPWYSTEDITAHQSTTRSRRSSHSHLVLPSSGPPMLPDIDIRSRLEFESSWGRTIS